MLTFYNIKGYIEKKKDKGRNVLPNYNIKEYIKKDK